MCKFPAEMTSLVFHTPAPVKRSGSGNTYERKGVYVHTQPWSHVHVIPCANTFNNQLFDFLFQTALSLQQINFQSIIQTCKTAIEKMFKSRTI